MRISQSKWKRLTRRVLVVCVMIIGLGMWTGVSEAQTTRSDVNGDGWADLIWRHGTNGQVVVWFLSADGTVSSGGFPGGAAAPWAVANVADVNGDGRADLIWQNSSSGQVVIWFLNADGTVSSGGFPGGAPSPWAVANVVDVNGDGRADLIWRHGTSGQVVVWFLNADGTVGEAGFPGGAGLVWQFPGNNQPLSPDLSVSQASLNLRHVLGSPGPLSTTITITNSGAETLEWTGLADLPEITLTPSGGSLIGGVSKSVIVTLNTTSLSTGKFSSKLTFKAPGRISDSTERVDLDVSVFPATAVGHFFACNFVTADDLFAAALVANPTNQQAHFFRALSRLLRMVEETQDGPNAAVFTDSLKEMLDRFGFAAEGRTICDFSSRPPKDVNGDVVLPGDSPTGEEVKMFLETVALPAVMASIQENIQAIDPSFELILGPLAVDSFGLKGEGPLEIDFGDVKLIEAALLDVKGAIQISLAYDLNVDVDQIVNLGDALQIQQDVVDANPGLLALEPSHPILLAEAKIALSQVVDAYNVASVFIRAETDNQDDDFVTIDPEDVQDEEELRTKLNQAQASLSGQTSIDIDLDSACPPGAPGSCNELVDLSLFFDTPFDLRGLLPTIGFDPTRDPANFIESRTFPDPTFNGMLPNMTQERLIEILDLDP